MDIRLALKKQGVAQMGRDRTVGCPTAHAIAAGPPAHR